MVTDHVLLTPTARHTAGALVTVQVSFTLIQPALYRTLHLTKCASVESTHTPTHQRLSSQGNGDTSDPISVGLA